MRNINVTIVNYDELDALVSSYFEIPSFECSLESPNDTDYLHENIKKRSLDEFEIEDIKEMKINKNCEYYRIDEILTELCNNDKIPEGNYLVSVSW